MSIFLTLLKGIGILLLAILGLLLAILLIVLLVPIRYRVSGARSPEDGVLTASGKVSWLASILAVTFAYDQELSWKVRICGIPLKRKKKEIPEDETEDLSAEQMAEIAALQAELEEEKVAASSTKGKNLVLQAQGVSQSEAGTLESMSGSDPKWGSESKTEPDAEATIEAQKVPVGQKIKELRQNISDKLRSFREKLAAIPDKIRSIKQQADTWIAFVKSDEVKQLISACWKQIKQIFHHILPTRLRIRGNYGFEDPSLTGKITGILCALPERYQKSIQLQPHFQEECLDGECMLKGRIRLGSLLFPVIKILLKPCTWKAYRRFRAITKSKETMEGASPQETASKDFGSKSKKKVSGPAGKNKKMKSNHSKNDPHKGGK